VLTGIGFVLVYASHLPRQLPLVSTLVTRARAAGRPANLAVRAFPAVSAAAVVLAGVIVTARALIQQGFLL
jgi:hypothetical protein